jgi:hypothetical protein
VCAKCTAPPPKRPAPAPVSRGRPNAPTAGRGLAGSARDDRASMRAQLLSTVGQGVQGCISGSSTSEARAAERARVLAAVGKQVDSTPPHLSRSERYNICSAERERAASAEKALAGSTLPPTLNEDAIMIGNAHSLGRNNDAAVEEVLAGAFDDGGGLFFCAAGRFCHTPDDLLRSGELLHCINCNRLTHETCSEPLLLQTPCHLPLASNCRW